MSLVLILEKQNNNDRLCLPRGSLSEVGWAVCYISVGLVGVCLEPLTSSRLLASRCILGFQATGLRPRRWFPQGSQSEVWWVLCYISIALVVDCLDVIKSDSVKVNFEFLGNWFATWSVTPTGIAKRSVMSCWYISIDLFDVYLDVIKGDDIMVHFGFPGKWFATSRVTPTRMAK